MLAVADTSPINYLLLIQCETVLPVLYARVVIPLAVWHELQDPDTPALVRAWVAQPPAWFAIQPLQQALPATAMPDLVQPAGITPRVPLVATRRISRAVLFSCTSTESALGDD